MSLDPVGVNICYCLVSNCACISIDPDALRVPQGKTAALAVLTPVLALPGVDASLTGASGHHAQSHGRQTCGRTEESGSSATCARPNVRQC